MSFGAARGPAPDSGGRPGAAAALPRPARARLVLAAAFSVVAWAWAWVGIRYAVRYYPPGALAFGRYALAALLMALLWARRGRRLPDARDWPGLAVMGLLGFSVYNVCVNEAERTIPPGVASMVAATIPVLTTVAAVALLGERLSRRGWLGVAIAFGGVALIGHSRTTIAGDARGIALLLIAVLATVGYNLYNKRFVTKYDPLDVTTWTIWAGALALLPLGGGLGEAVATAPASATWTVVGLAVFPGALAYALWAWALVHLPLARLSSGTFLVPVLALVMGYLFLGEAASPAELVGGLVALLGVWLVLRR